LSGCASGIGKHMALALARRGERLMLIDRDAEGLRQVLREAGLDGSEQILTRAHDVRDAAGWETLIDDVLQRFGSLDVMLNIAGVLKVGFVHHSALEDVDSQIDINAKGVMYATRAGARIMLRQGHGHIVNIASLAGISHVPGMAVYCASKHAVRAFSLAVAHELRPHGVHVSVFCPDAVETPMLERQANHDEAAMTFAGGRGLTLPEVERALFDVLEKRPLEVILPVPRSGRAMLARMGNLFPDLVTLGLERVQKKGREVQAARNAADVKSR
jgi:3-oxoacyl-[acyl-carrier protein] reductase